MSSDLDNLLQQLDDDDSNVRLRAADALGKIGGNIAINALCRALGDKDPNDPVGSCNVRLSAVYALARIGKPAVEALCKMSENFDKDVRGMACSALGKIADLRAVQPLCAALSDDEGDVRASAVCALGEIGRLAVEPLCRMLDPKEDWTVRTCAANALARIGDARAVEPLREALRRIDNPIRKIASWAFAERLDFLYGVRQTARDAEADALREALERIIES
jgi:HEAT repeat protein